MKTTLRTTALLSALLPVAAFAQDEPVTLNWALWDWNAVAYYQPLIDAYQAANPHVTINHTDLGSADYPQMVMTQLAGGATNLDVIQIKDVPNYVQLVGINALENLTEAQQNPVDNPATQALSIDGSYYGMPFRSDLWILYYNRDLFDAAGVDYPTNDMTWDEYYAKAREMTQGFGMNKVYGTHNHVWATLAQIWGQLDGDHALTDADLSYLQPWYEQALALQDEGVTQTYATLKTSSTHYSGPFYNEQVAMMPMGLWFIGTLIDKVAAGEVPSDNWAIASVPHAEGVEPGTTASQITSLGVNRNSPNKQAALDFVNWVGGPEGAEIIAATGTLPAVMTDEVMAQITALDGFPQDETSKAALRAPRSYLQLPVVMNAPELNIVLDRGHDSIMTENVSIEEGIAQMQEAAARLTN